MSTFKDYTGFKFNKMTVVKRFSKNKRTYYLCECECGNMVELRGDSVASSRLKSCGKCSNNSFEEKEGVVIGTTSAGDEYYFDLDDYDFVRKYSWIKTSNGYISASIKGQKTYLHRALLLPPKDLVVDHINRVKHDNQKENLRVVDRTLNEVNKGLKSNNTSGKTGVYFDSSRQKWAAQITRKGTTYNLGRFRDKEAAIKARREKELELFGEHNPTTTKGEKNE